MTLILGVALIIGQHAICGVPSGFEENRGQTSPSVRFLARARGQHVFFTDASVVFSPHAGAEARMSFVGAGIARWTPDSSLTDTISYFIGNDPSKWVQSAPMFDRLAWRGMYPAVDAVFYLADGHLEYDLVLSPGADPSRVRLRFSGGTRIRDDGSIQAGGIRQRPPRIYQEGHRVSGRFVTAGNGEFRLHVDAYDRARPLVVDPVIEAASYIGGENDDEVTAVTNNFVAGNTRSVGFPGAIMQRRSRDVFVRSAGGTGQASGIIVVGGTADDELTSVAISPGRETILAGTTRSTDLPGAYASSYRGGASDGFVITLPGWGPPRTFPLLAQYVGGSGEDRIHACATALSAWICAGETNSADLPAASGSPAGGMDAFYVASYFYSNPLYGYLGGEGDDAAYAVAASQTGLPLRFWVGGETRSGASSDAFLAEGELRSDGIREVNRYPIGGNGDDRITGLTVRSIGAAYEVGIAGTTTSNDLPVRNAAQSRLAGDTDIFAGVWATGTAAFRWLTYLGGSGPDRATALAEDSAGGLYVGGWTRSADLPVVAPVEQKPGGGDDGLFAILDQDGALLHFSYYGGNGDDRILHVALGSNNVLRIGGSTSSTDLPEVQRWQQRGARLEGFFAEIGSDHLIGPNALTMARDMALLLRLSPGRTSLQEAITYRSSDPAKLQFSYRGRKAGELFAVAGETVTLEALADSGDVEIIASGPTFIEKRVRVRLYPGAFVPVIPAKLSAWPTGSLSLFAQYCAIDPATNETVVCAYTLRSGIPAPVFRWTSSDPSVLEVTGVWDGSIGTSVSVRSVGQTRLSLQVDGYRVLEPPSTIVAVERPQFEPRSGFRLAHNTEATLPLSFTFNSFLVNFTQGALTARSEDPSRLLLATAPHRRGAGQVTLSMSGPQPLIWAQALAGEGEVRVLFTSSEFEGEAALTVTLEPLVLQLGQSVSGGGIEPNLQLGVNASSNIAMRLGNAPTGVTLRAGAPPIIITAANSDPRVVELNQLTVIAGANSYSVTGMAPGRSQLTFAVTPDTVLIPNPVIEVTVSPSAGREPAVIPDMLLGKDLQASVSLRYTASEVTAAIEDAGAATLSESTSSPGTSQVVLRKLGYPGEEGESKFYINGLRAQGETRVRLRYSDGAERSFKVTLAPSGLGFYQFGGLQVAAWVLDESTGIGLFIADLRPGATMGTRLRIDGASAQVTPSSVTLTNQAPRATLQVTPPAPGEPATLILEPASGTSVSSNGGTLPLSSYVPLAAQRSGPIRLIRDDVSELRLQFLPGVERTVTSADPERLLVRATPTQTGSQSVRLPQNATSVYLEALAEIGSTTVRVEAPGHESVEMQVGFGPLNFNMFLGSAWVGTTVPVTVSLNAGRLRAEAGTLRFKLQSSDPAILTLQPETVELSSSQPTASVEIQAKAIGRAQVLVEGPPHVGVTPDPLLISVVPPISPAPRTYALGKNVQGSLSLSLPESLASPTGSIVTVTSSDPSRVLLSRSPSVTGSASVTLAVPAGTAPTTQPFYAQALTDNGEVALRSESAPGLDLAIIRLVPSWIGCSQTALDLKVGETNTLDCGVQFDNQGALPGEPLKDLRAIPAFNDQLVGVTSSAPEVFSVSPARIPITEAARLVFTGLQEGEGNLIIEQPAGFNARQASESTVWVHVVRAELRASCPQVLAKDTQGECSGPAGMTAVSGDPALLLVSADPRSTGSAQATAGPAGITVQALAAFGTVEVTFSAPGYTDVRVPVFMRRGELRFSQPDPLGLAVGQSWDLPVAIGYGLNSPSLTPRAGATLTAELTASPPGIVTIQNPRVSFTGPNPAFTIRAAAPGSTVLRLVSPEGLSVLDRPILVTVRPN